MNPVEHWTSTQLSNWFQLRDRNLESFSQLLPDTPVSRMRVAEERLIYLERRKKLVKIQRFLRNNFGKGHYL